MKRTNVTAWHVVVPLTLVATLAVLANLRAAPGGEAPTLVLTGGRIWTGDATRPWAEAVAIRGDRIVAVGSAAEIAKLPPSEKAVDLHGRFVMPGINDAHIHFLSGALRLSELDLNDATSLTEIQQRLAGFAKTNEEAPWLLGFGWTYTSMPGGRLPTAADLDAVVKDRPVWLSAYDGHTGWANSKALELAGVTAKTTFEGFGEVVRDADGNPTGVLKEGAQRLVRQKVPTPTRAQRLDAAGKMLAWVSQLGITSIQNASGTEADLEIFEELLNRGELTSHTSVAISIAPTTPDERIAEVAALAKQYSGPMLRVSGIKMLVDGVIESHTAAMVEPYSDGATTRGEPAFTQQDLNRLVLLADKAGLQVLIHAIGDRGVRMALDAYENARRVNGARDSRHRIEHIETIQTADMPRFAQLGVMASMEPIHADPGTADVWSRAIGPERAKRGFAWRSLEQAGARLVFSSDWPAAISIDPIRGLHNAINRQTKEGTPPGGWNPEQRVSMDTALRAYTQAGAYSSFEEKDKGMIAPRMRADVIVLSGDPFKTPPAKIHTLRVETTIFDGKIIQSKP